jgi:uncharacterized protein (DUF2141 family)
MKTAMLTLSLAALFAVSPARASDVTIHLRGVETSAGDLYVGIQTRDQYLQNTGTYGAIIKAPKGGDQTVVVKGVAPGEYSVSVWHDINNNQKFDAADNGMPLDGWSMVGAEKLRGAPIWDQTKFVAGADGAQLDLSMIYAK